MRLIDADVLRADAITRSGGTEFAFDNCYPFWQFSQAIAQAPTIEAAPVVHGRWNELPSMAPEYECSECGRSYEWWEIDEVHYCPNCGAKMDGGGGDG